MTDARAIDALRRIADALEKLTTPVTVVEFPNGLTAEQAEELLAKYRRDHPT